MIGVSVLCFAYNQEKYIRKTLEGLVSQQTNFEYEVLIHDDASTDKTPDIIMEYVEKYERIKWCPMLQKVNKYSQKKPLVDSEVLSKMNGKYIAFCEGDDYWDSEFKLQQQYDMLEKQQDSIICLHTVRVIKEDGVKTSGLFPTASLNTGEYPVQNLFDYIANDFFHMSSFFIRLDYYKNYHNNKPEFSKNVGIGDIPLLLWICSKSNRFCYINSEMSCYRLNSIGSWNSRNMCNKDSIKKHEEKMFLMIEKFDQETEGKYSDFCDKFRLTIQFNDRMKSYEYREIMNNPKFRTRFIKLPIKDRLRFIYKCVMSNIIQK